MTAEDAREKRPSLAKRIFSLYYDGFRSMTVGRTLWILILVKLFIMFAILKVFFFPNFLNSQFDSDEAKSEYVLERLTDVNDSINQKP